MHSRELLHEIVQSGKSAGLTLVVCSLLYPAVILLLGHAITPNRAEGSLLRSDNGHIIGSRLIAQGFSRPEYFHSRPSAVDYNASSSGGSNLTPNGQALRQQAIARIDSLHAISAGSIPPELVTASGSGLDPHLTVAGIKAQIDRVAQARGISTGQLNEWVDSFRLSQHNQLLPAELINVLELNLYLDNHVPLHSNNQK